MATGDMLNIFPDNNLENETEELWSHAVNVEDHEPLENGLAPIFYNDNIVTEDIFEVRFKDDVYYQGETNNINDIVKEFKAVEDITTLMFDSVQNAEDNDAIINAIPTDSSDNVRTSKSTIEAALGITSTINDFGELMKRGSRCSVCGKPMEHIPVNGYCSVECALEDLGTRLLSFITGEYPTETPKWMNKLENTLDYINLVFNVFAKLPDVLASIAKLPEEYRNYAINKVNIIFLYLKKIINLLLIKKNEIILGLLSMLNYDLIDEKLANKFDSINSFIKSINALREKLNNSLNTAYEAINVANKMYYIGPHEIGFFFTIKSALCPCPYIRTDITTFPPDQLGMPFWGPISYTIPLDLTRCQFIGDVGAKSVLSNVDQLKIDKIVRKIFKPIQPIEYFMDPDLFEFRLAFSDLNSSATQKVIKNLAKLVVIGGDVMPSYDNLKLTNIWFIIAILTCWGPWTKAIYGDFVLHPYIF